jgi:hypothetical protein
VTEKICQFIREIDISVEAAIIDEDTFLPGIYIRDGAILVDEDKLLYPGDLLHEAAHLATTVPEERDESHAEVGESGGDEMMAIAWSWAALVHLELDPEVVFHPGGYKGWSRTIIESFSEGRYFGVPMLQWLGMTADKKRAEQVGTQPFPHMIKWLRDT